MTDNQSAMSRRLFISYARNDRERVATLKRGLERLQHQVWIDDRLSVGQAWWDEILQQIRNCDAVVVAVSPALNRSQASDSERNYARQLGKRLLPVCVRAVSAQLLPPDLAPLQFVDYSEPGPDAAFQLAASVNALPPSLPLPDHLPEPPPAPLSYMNSLGQQVNAAALTLDEQFVVVARLRDALAEPDHRVDALSLLHSMERRVDLYHAPARQITEILNKQPDPLGDGPAMTGTADGTGPPMKTGIEAADAVPIGRSEPKTSVTPSLEERRRAADGVAPGWYPDPTGRHKLRWFQGDWSDWASDGGTTINDRL